MNFNLYYVSMAIFLMVLGAILYFGILWLHKIIKREDAEPDMGFCEDAEIYTVGFRPLGSLVEEQVIADVKPCNNCLNCEKNYN